MKPKRLFRLVPTLPAVLTPLREIAYNLRFAWDTNAQSLFKRLDPTLWESTRYNPVQLLNSISQKRLDEAAVDADFVAAMQEVQSDLHRYLQVRTTWDERGSLTSDGPLVAYFSAEFGLTDCLSIFAGGLGVLAGDHLKSSSDLGIPLIAVGLLYQQGYFHQYLNEAGWQQEAYQENVFATLPLVLECASDQKPLLINVDFPGRTIYAQVWRAQVGRVPLYLLDTNIPDNAPEDRDITDQLYGGDIENRIKQEILLGIGGYRALEALRIAPSVYHMNEGHSAFLALERVRCIMESGASFDEAREAASAGLVFTTHTPVAAGHDYFPADLMERYFSEFMSVLGLSRRDFLALGRQNPDDEHERFCMTILALRLASHSNGVSQLHGHVSREMWQGIWPGVPVEEIPIGAVTNGIHLRTWVSPDMAQLYDRYLGAHWRDDPSNGRIWANVPRIPDGELWEIHERNRHQLVDFVRRRVRWQLLRRGASRSELSAVETLFSPDIMTIGFGRRFASYKRATLLLSERERLARIVSNPDRPVQIIFAGKAHPRDEPGKALIQEIVTLSAQTPFRGRVVFLEDYDMSVGAAMVQGSDVWLNNPRRPMEASGTSGMKAAANGVINASTLDGWWAEAWEHEPETSTPFGWAIGEGENYRSFHDQDTHEAEALYDLLEHDIVPAFYSRDDSGLPSGWIRRMKSSIGNLTPFFNTNRMVWEYAERFYVPAARRYQEFVRQDFARAKEFADWREKIEVGWHKIRIIDVQSDIQAEARVGEPFQVRALVHLHDLKPEDVAVQLYLGPVDAKGEFTDARVLTMEPNGHRQESNFEFYADAILNDQSGPHGFNVRVVPRHPDLVSPFIPGMICWA